VCALQLMFQAAEEQLLVYLHAAGSEEPLSAAAKKRRKRKANKRAAAAAECGDSVAATALQEQATLEAPVCRTLLSHMRLRAAMFNGLSSLVLLTSSFGSVCSYPQLLCGMRRCTDQAWT
jgi:hypothetical protein